MSENKFIKHLRGEDTAKSVLEIKNQRTTTSFANMPEGNTSNANDVYSDHRGDAACVLKGTENWKLNGSVLIETQSVYGDGRDFTDSFDIDGNVLWVNATHTFATARRFAPNTKFVLKLCGHDLNTVIGDTISFTLLVKFGTNNVISKVFNITEQAFDFCKEFVIDFGESNASAIKVTAGSTMTVQLLCADPVASATIYNGMTVFTALQRRVDSETVSSDTWSLDEIEYDLTSHINDKNNPHEVTKAQVGLGNCDNTSDLDKPISTATQTALDGKVSTDGSSTMTGPLKMRATSSFRCAIAPSWDGVGFYKLNSDDSVTLIASIETPDGFVPWVTDTYNIGSSLKKWKNLYLAGKAYMSVINNGYDIAVPVTNRPDTFALKSEVDLAANSGSQLYTTGVWYAKMYSASTVPTGAEYDGKNYADFSQVDNDNNPIIVIYEGQSGAWVEIDRITPPATYNGYVTITSKIWDIAEQTDQQGGEVLWSYNQKTFTPYPKIVSLLNQANTDLSNLTSVGQNIGNWSSNVTNCIINIPQDIKLELNNGTLTLKAGSKVYVPNGTGVFTELTINNDIAKTDWGSSTGTYYLCVNEGGTYLYGFATGLSGTSTSAEDGMYYRTNQNYIYPNNNSSVTKQSFPICKVTVNNGGVTSIDQVFNGFGYIGLTLFVLPGIKGLHSARFNSDGTLHNDVTIVQQVLVYTTPNAGANQVGQLILSKEGRACQFAANASYWQYESRRNLFVFNVNGDTNWIDIGTYVWDGTRITKFNPKTAFHAVDYSDYQEQIATLLQAIYPVGSIYIGTQATCPLATLIPGSVWTAVQGRYLLASGTLAGTSESYSATNTVASGLPNITGEMTTHVRTPVSGDSSGAFVIGGSEYVYTGDYLEPASRHFYINAANSNSVYNQSGAVRAPAYVVNVWRRTA